MPGWDVDSAYYGKWELDLDLDSAGQSTSASVEYKVVPERHRGEEKDSSSQLNDSHAAFWDKLKSSAEKKLGPNDAEKFCKAFQQVYRRLVHEELSLEAAQAFVNYLGK
ncbi:OLC1v1005239C1 [Oldenlandia corymbosa var. corymbosa]|uniref:OLC1v1005239C1 n=1 Tax=Oldenlandia corymbosa var. corymbosa TaxID=529605 RepID=A0AAV1DEQ8_OLDCO|nr:OLC1v1005239C1 [Oldenlandia corymbosa var. corymbosa]